MRLQVAARVLAVAVSLSGIFLPREAGYFRPSIPGRSPEIVSPAISPVGAAPASGQRASPRARSSGSPQVAPLAGVARRAPSAGPVLATAARAARHERAPFEPRSRSTPRALRALERAGLMRLEASFQSSVGDVVHEPYRLHKHGLPIFNRTGRLHRRESRVFAQTGKLTIPPLVLEPASISSSASIESALAAVPGRQQRAPARSQRGWLATAQGTLPIWQVTLAMSDPLGSWLVRVDARDGSTVSADNLIRTDTGSGLVYRENIVSTPVPASLPLSDLDGAGFLHGRVTQVFDVRDVEAYRPDLVFDFGESDPRFVQTSVYRALTDAARYAEAHGLAAFDDRVLAFTNLFGGPNGEEFNNAFYDPFFPIFGFGNGDGSLTANLGTDADVAIHEMGHHLFAKLVDPLGSSSLRAVAAIDEGFSDTLAAFVNDDPEIGESTLPGRPFLRTVANGAVWPDDTDIDPHVEGLIYGGLNWDLRNALGNDLAADIVISALPFLEPDDDFPAQAFREALLQAGQVVNGGATNATIRALADNRGLVSRDDLAFAGFLSEGSPQDGTLQEGEFQVYLFAEFPASRQITIRMTGTGDADLLVAPVSIFDPADVDTFFFPGDSSSNERVDVSAVTTPSVNAGDLWIVAVEDFVDGQASNFQLHVTSVLPLPAISAGGSYFGTIAEGGDFEFITFSGSADQIVRLEATALGEDLDIAVAIFEPRTFETFGADDDSGEGTDSLIQGARLPETQTYGIAIFSLIADIDPTVGVGDFRLDLSNCANTGPDFDSDGQVDACDDDDDDDGFVDSVDTDPLDARLCQDIEGDGCDDCQSGVFAPFDDGPNADGDHLCDDGDPDDDNDGCEDPIDPFPFDPSVDGDVDLVGEDCDNCKDDFNPDQADFDLDGQGDVCDPTPMPEPSGSALAIAIVATLALLRERVRRLSVARFVESE